MQASLIKLILQSDKTIEEKQQLIVELNEREKQEEKSSLEIQQLEEKSSLKIQLREEKIQSLLKEQEHLIKEKEHETLYKKHYQKLLTVRSVIENFEKSFGEAIQKKKIPRVEKWKEFLSSYEEKFKPFKDAGFTIETVSDAIDIIFKRHSADIHSVQSVEVLVLEVRGILTDDQAKIVPIIVQISPWKDMIKIE